MTTIEINPNFRRKSAVLSGDLIAAGEHVLVKISNMQGKVSDSLFLRIMFGPTTIAQFPKPVNEPDEERETWSYDSDTQVASCELNLNTLQARRMCLGTESECLIVLEDIGAFNEDMWEDSTPPQLLLTKHCRVLGWPARKGVSEPLDLDPFIGALDRKAWREELAPLYDAAKTYKQNDLVTLGGKLYMANTDTTAGAFDPTKWDVATIADAIATEAETREKEDDDVVADAKTYTDLEIKKTVLKSKLMSVFSINEAKASIISVKTQFNLLLEAIKEALQ